MATGSDFVTDLANHTNIKMDQHTSYDRSASPGPRTRLFLAVLLLWVVPGTLWAEAQKGLKVYAHTFEHQDARDALARIRVLLSPFGTVEEQPGTNTLVIRDIPANVQRMVPVLEAFDQPPEDLRFDIQIIRAGPKEAGKVDRAEKLPAESAARLRRHLRYDDYRILAQASMTSKEGEEVTYSLGESYHVSFRLGALMQASSPGKNLERLKLENFQVVKNVRNSSNKGRRLEPHHLYRATLNVWVDRPFNLVLSQDESRQEALMVVISCRREGVESR